MQLCRRRFSQPIDPCRISDKPDMRERHPVEAEIGSAFSDDIEAELFFLKVREPSFYLGLFGPLLLSVLRGGIAYTGGLRLESPRPDIQWMLSLEPCSSRSPSPCVTRSSGYVDMRRARYGLCLRTFPGSYSSLVFHSDNVIEAILRANVSLARLGFVPCASSF
jgi:hypothetical protein